MNLMPLETHLFLWPWVIGAGVIATAGMMLVFRVIEKLKG